MRRFQYFYIITEGFIVFRILYDWSSNQPKVTSEEKIAVFVCENEAKDYCEYRNEMLNKHGTDNVYAIEHNDTY